MTKEFLENGILVYGPRKSGTTLLQNLLDGSNNIMMLPDELKLKFIVKQILKSGSEKKEFYFREGRSSFRRYLELSRTGDTYTIRNKGPFRVGNISEKDVETKFDVEGYIGELQKIANNKKIMDLKDIYSHDVLSYKGSMKAGGDYRYWASKEVGGDPESIMIHFKSMFERSKCIFIARDPKMIVRSIILKERRKGRQLSVADICRESFQAVKVISYFAGETGTSEHILVFYEDLVTHTRETMKHITEFLHIPYENIFERPSIFGDPVTVRTASKNTKTVFSEKDDWKKELTFREKITVMAFHTVYALWGFLFGRNRMTYRKLRQRSPL